MKISLRDITYVLLIFIYIFVPPLLPRETLIIMCGFILYFICNFCRINNNLSMKKIYTIIIAFISLIIWVSISYMKVYGTLRDIMPFLINYIYILGYSVLGAVVLCDLSVKNQYTEKKIWKSVIYAGGMQGILALVAFAFKPVQNFLCIFLENIMARDIIEWWCDYRLYGLSCSLTYTMPIVQALIGGLAILYARRYEHKMYFMVPILWVSAIINARVSIIVIIIEIIVLEFQHLKNAGNFRIKQSRLAVILFGIIIGVIGIITIYVKEINISRIIDPFIEIIFLLQGKIVFKTEGYLAYFFRDSNALVIPQKKDLLFGGGIWNCVSDIGYLHNLWAGGVMYCLCLYCLYIVLLKKWGEKLKKEFCSVNMIFGICMFVVNIKGDFFGGMNEVQNLFFLLLGITLFIKRKGAAENFG